MSDLAEFLAVRLDEDEIAAKTAAIRLGSCWHVHLDPPVQEVRAGGDLAIARAAEMALGHIARYDPDRVLREAGADRKLLAALEEAERRRSPHDDPYDPAASFSAGEYAGLLAAARFRAGAWSDHPDYNPEWARA